MDVPYYVWIVVCIVLVIATKTLADAYEKRQKAAIKEREQKLRLEEMGATATLMHTVHTLITDGMAPEHVAALLPAHLRADFIATYQRQITQERPDGTA